MNPEVLSAFLHQYLPHSFPSTQDATRIIALAGDASSRRYFRAQGSDGKTVILTLYPEVFGTDETALERLQRLTRENPSTPLSYANDPLAQIEMTGFLKEQGLPVPALIAVDGSRGIIAFEDLGDVRLIEAMEGLDLAGRTALYERSLALIVSLQQTTPALMQRAMVGSTLEFDAPKLLWEMDFFLTHYFGSYRQTPLSPEDHTLLRRELEPICSWLAHRPQVLCHRDYHARNLLVREDVLYLIDYQDARRGPVTYDLVSLLLDPYAPVSDLDLEALLELFCEQTHRHRNRAFMREWEAMAIQRLLKACGTYAYQTAVRKASQFESYLIPTLAHACSFMRAHGGCESLLERLDTRSH